jgi:ketosteroid isomerase-like protein
MSTEENKAVMQRICEEVIQEGKIGKLDELVASDYTFHGPGGQEIKGVEGLKRLMAWLHASFPDIHFTVDDVIAEGEKVVSFYTMKGTHKSNKPVNFQGIMISRFANGREIECWEIYDRFTIASQLAPGWAKALLRLIESQMVKDRP